MRILVEPSDYVLRNVGDMAMLHVAVSRLGALWPEASIQVLSDTPELLPRYCPNSEPLDASGRRAWFTDGLLFARLFSYLPGGSIDRIVKLERYLRCRWPWLVASLMKLRLKWGGDNRKVLLDFLEAVMNADLVIVTGMGGITDAFPEYALQVLETLNLAIQGGAITAMVGQGMGPIADPILQVRAKAVLPQVNFISLREGRAGIPLLHSLGVAPECILTTGDDAIEMAYQLRCQQLGNGLGINLRASQYALVDHSFIEQLRHLLQEAAKAHQAFMVPVPISRVPGEEDASSIQQLMNGYDLVLGEDINADTSLRVIEQIKHCRVVVTGSYHAGVFALSLGIPVVALANSPYYRDKFLGLADQFGIGCEVVFLHDPELPAKLRLAIEQSWQRAEQLRPSLLAAAARQIELSHTAYQKVYELTMSHRSLYQLPVRGFSI